MNVHFLYPLKPFEIDFFSSKFSSSVQFSHGKDAESNETVQLLIGGRPSEHDLERFPNAKTLFIPYAGVPADLKSALGDDDTFVVYNLHHNALNTAEFGVALMMSVMKQILPFDNALRKNDWSDRFNPAGTQVISGKHVLMLGWGHIAKHAARMCEGLEMRVTALNRSSESAWLDGTVRVDGIARLDDYLPEADVLFLALPLTPETEGLMDAERFELMKPTSIVVNIARGPILDEQAFFEALRDGVISGAGVDVWYNYPASKAVAGETAPSEFAFGDLTNAVLSPHRGASAGDYREFTNDEIAQFVLNFAGGDVKAAPVDLERGY